MKVIRELVDWFDRRGLLGEADMADAVAWARSAAALTAAQPQVAYAAAPAPKRRVSPPRKAATPRKPARGR